MCIRDRYWNVCVYNQKKKLVKQEDYAQTGQKFTVKAAKGQKLYVMVKARKMCIRDRVLIALVSEMSVVVEKGIPKSRALCETYTAAFEGYWRSR